MEAFGYEGLELMLNFIIMTSRIWKNLGIDAIQLELNSLGTSKSRKNYRATLVEYFKDHIDSLDEDSFVEIEKKSMRILDSKNQEMSALIDSAPKMNDHLDQNPETISMIY